MCTKTSQNSGSCVTWHEIPDADIAPTLSSAVPVAFDSLAKYGSATSGVTEFKLPSVSVSTTTEGCSSVAVTREQCEAILTPISSDIRKLMMYPGSMFGHVPFEQALWKLIASPIAGHKLWKLQVDTLLDMTDKGNIAVYECLQRYISFIPHSNFVTFIKHLASRMKEEQIPLAICTEFGRYMALEALIREKSDPSISLIRPIIQDLVTKQAKALQPLTKNFFLDSVRMYKQVTIDASHWGSDSKSMDEQLSGMLWDTLWNRILELKKTYHDQPLQIKMVDSFRFETSDDLVTQLKKAAVKEGIFFRTSKAYDERQCEISQRAPDQENLLVQGLPWKTPEQADELLAYLKSQNLLAYAASD